MRPIQTVTPDQLMGWMQDNKAVVIDVREISEYQERHIEGVVHMPLSEVCLNHPKMPPYKGKYLIFQCKTGRRSHVACEKIIKGDPEVPVWNLVGGIVGWVSAHLPVVCASAPKAIETAP